MLYAVGSEDAARRAARAMRIRRLNRMRDLDPAKRERDLAALDSETRRRVENYRNKTHL